MVKLNIKPLSVNKCWQGRRFKTQDYKYYEEELMYLLPDIYIPRKECGIIIEIGVNKLFDIDNCLKPLLDILQKKYNFNDRDIMKLEIEKKAVKKGKEYIKFKLYDR
jgi:Holliday junction resolvase RusA-like endonuclease